MLVTVNEQAMQMPEPHTLVALLRQLAPETPFAVARNGEFVPRHSYAECGLNAGDRIEIVRPSAGG